MRTARFILMGAAGLLGLLCGSSVAFGQATRTDEEPAYNDLLARSFMIEVQPLVERFTGWSVGGFPKFRTVSRTEYCRVMGQSVAARARIQFPKLTEAQALEMAMKSLEPLSKGLLGQYDYTTKMLYLLPGNLKPILTSMNIHPRYTRDLIEVIIAHEMTHAVQDAAFPQAPIVEGLRNQDDAFEAYAMLIEGHACFVQQQVAKELKLDESAALLIQRMNVENARSLAASGRGSWDRYLTGKRFVDAIFAKGGLPAIQALFAHPPTSQFQIRAVAP